MSMPNFDSQTAGRNRTSLLMAAGLTVLALTLVGCGEGMGGGASYPVRVSILPDADAQVDADASAASANVEVAGYGTLKGRVVVEGAVKLPPPIKPSKDAFCIAKSPIPNDEIVTGADGGLANVFIYLPKAPDGTKQPETLPPVTFDQQGCRFEPHCLVVETAQEILILNSDGTLHNTNVSADRNAKVNLAVNPHTTMGLPYSFRRPEKTPAKVTCDIHSWMRAYQLPLDHPYGVVSAKDGTFEIPNLPAGKHQFTIWHEAAGVINGRYEVDIPVDGTTEVEIKIPAQTLAGFNGPQPRTVVLSMVP